MLHYLKTDYASVQQFLLLFTPVRVENTLSNIPMFFIVGMGRSGTVFLTHLINEVSKYAVYHEVPSDRKALVQAYWDLDKAGQHLSGFRSRLIAARILQSKCLVYGEVNSYLRYHVAALKELWQPTILHLVRDGRSVVRSLMNRTAFSPADKKHTGLLAPHSDDPFLQKWPNMDRFARVCWYWASTNQDLLKHNLPLIRFEDITCSFEQFQIQVLQPLKTTIPINTWEKHIDRPKNISKITSFPAWQDWSVQQKQQFELICGDVMSYLGYAI